MRLEVLHMPLQLPNIVLSIVQLVMSVSMVVCKRVVLALQFLMLSLQCLMLSLQCRPLNLQTRILILPLSLGCPNKRGVVNFGPEKHSHLTGVLCGDPVSFFIQCGARLSSQSSPSTNHHRDHWSE